MSSPRKSAFSPADSLAAKIRILDWVFVGRALLAFALLFHIFAAEPVPGRRGYLTALLVGTLVFTALSYLVTRSGVRFGGRPFLYAQVIFDALLLTAVVYLTGGQRSMYAPLYILVISAGALLLPMLGGIVIGLLASILYFITAVIGSGGIDEAILLQATLFATVALVTGYLGDRLRHTGLALGEVETELRRLQLGTDDILETIGTGILSVDGEGCLLYLNPAAAHLLSLDPVAWRGRPILGELDRIAPGLGRIIERTASERLPVRRFQTDPLDEDSFVLGVSTTLLDPGGEARPPVTAIFQDITERMRAEGLRRRAERLEAVAELSASLAHEIKNPLASIRSAVEQMASGTLASEDAHFLGTLIMRESDRLSRLLGEFIDFTRVKVVSPQAIDFAGLIHEVAEIVRAHPDARATATRISVQAPATPVYIRGAEDLLHRATFNLLLNAVQWAGPEGRVEVELKEVRSDLLSPALGAFRLIHLAVRDSGPGVPEGYQEQVFDPFFTHRKGGSGLGLAIVQRAVEAHGGAVFVDRSPAGSAGATFALYLPALAPDAATTTDRVTGRDEDAVSLTHLDLKGTPT